MLAGRLVWRSPLPLGNRPRWPLVPSPAFIALLVLCGSLFLQGIGSREMWASHEARAAQNAQRMLDDGDWLLPRLYDGQVELQKPAGFYWLVAAVGSLRGGVDAWAVRLPAAVAGTLTVLMVWWHLCRRGRPLAGFLAAAMLAGAVHFTGTARIGRIDVPLACAVCAFLLFSRDALAEREASRSASASRLTAIPRRCHSFHIVVCPINSSSDSFTPMLRSRFGTTLRAGASTVTTIGVWGGRCSGCSTGTRCSPCVPRTTIAILIVW